MADEKNLDEKIGRLVRSVELEVPEAAEARIRAAAADLRPRSGFFARRWPLWLALIPSAAAIFLAAFFLLPVFQKPQQTITEIRTEFEIADKNIKIIFFQRPDFKLL